MVESFSLEIGDTGVLLEELDSEQAEKRAITVNAVRAAVMNFFFMFIIYNNYVRINVKNREPSPLSTVYCLLLYAFSACSLRRLSSLFKGQ